MQMCVHNRGTTLDGFPWLSIRSSKVQVFAAKQGKRVAKTVILMVFDGVISLGMLASGLTGSGGG